MIIDENFATLCTGGTGWSGGQKLRWGPLMTRFNDVHCSRSNVPKRRCGGGDWNLLSKISHIFMVTLADHKRKTEQDIQQEKVVCVRVRTLSYPSHDVCNSAVRREKVCVFWIEWGNEEIREALQIKRCGKKSKTATWREPECTV